MPMQASFSQRTHLSKSSHDRLSRFEGGGTILKITRFEPSAFWSSLAHGLLVLAPLGLQVQDNEDRTRHHQGHDVGPPARGGNLQGRGHGGLQLQLPLALQREPCFAEMWPMQRGHRRRRTERTAWRRPRPTGGKAAAQAWKPLRRWKVSADAAVIFGPKMLWPQSSVITKLLQPDKRPNQVNKL